MPLTEGELGFIVKDITSKNHVAEAQALWDMVKSQAVRHTRAVLPEDLLRSMRPNESQFIRDYRLDNYRAFTNEGYVKFTDKAARIINKSNWTIINESEELREWVATSEFIQGNGEKVKFNQFFSKVVMPCSFEDPNALLVAFPFNKDNPFTPPANDVEDGGLPPNEKIDIKTKIIPSDDVVFTANNAFAWFSGYWSFMDGKKEVSAPFFFLCDDSNYYRVIPVSRAKGEGSGRNPFVYDVQLWYFHDTGKGERKELPINILGGTLTKDVETDSKTYNESYLKPFFEFGDEFIVAYSDYQAVRVKSAYPVRVMTERPCQECGGSGKVKHRGEDGDYLGDCGSCGGSRVEKGLSPFKDVIVPDGKSLAGDGGNRKPLEYVSPDVQILEFINNDSWALFDKALKSINLDLLIDMNESGEAMKQRLTDLHDMLMKISGNMFDTMRRHLWFVECLLQPSRSQRQFPIIVEPVSFEIKTEEMLRDEALKAPLSDKVTALMEYHKKKYSGNRKLVRIKELALLYAPLLAVESPQELQVLLASGAYGPEDVIKRDSAEMVMKMIASEMKDSFFEESRNLEIFLKADELMRQFLPEQAIPIME